MTVPHSPARGQLRRAGRFARRADGVPRLRPGRHCKLTPTDRRNNLLRRCSVLVQIRGRAQSLNGRYRFGLSGHWLLGAPEVDPSEIDTIVVPTRPDTFKKPFLAKTAGMQSASTPALHLLPRAGRDCAATFSRWSAGQMSGHPRSSHLNKEPRQRSRGGKSNDSGEVTGEPSNCKPVCTNRRFLGQHPVMQGP